MAMTTKKKMTAKPPFLSDKWFKGLARTGELRLVVIVTIGAVIALSIFFGAKELISNYNEQQAAAEQARLQQGVIEYQDQLTQLSSLKDEAARIQEENVDFMQWSVDTCNQDTVQTSKRAEWCVLASERLEEAKNMLKQKVDKYNALATTIPGDILDYAGLPSSL